MSAALAYVAIPVDSLVGTAKLDFDLYVQLNTKHVLYFRKGGALDAERLAKMRAKNVRRMWIVSDDEKNYREYFAARLDEAYSLNSSMTASERVLVIHSALTAMTEAIFRDPANPGLYYNASEGAKRLAEFIVREENAIKLLLSVPKAEKSIAAHGVSTAVVALAIAKQLGLGKNGDLHLLALGCFLHDGGHFGQESRSLGKNVKALTLEDLKWHRDHPMAGARSLQEIAHYDQHVIRIIIEHEEHIDGTGFPKGLNEKQMHAYSVIAATANAFDRLMTFDEETCQGAMKRLVVDKIGRHPLPHINALKAIVQALS